MNKNIIDCSTGKAQLVAMTPDEIAAREAEIADAIANEPQPPTEQTFSLPIVAPVVRAGEFVEAPEYIVASPKPKDKPKDALEHAAALAVASKKPLAEILLNLMVYIQDLERRVMELEK